MNRFGASHSRHLLAAFWQLALALLLFAGVEASARVGARIYSSGEPTQMGFKLGPENYIQIALRRLKSAPVIWTNFDSYRSQGIEIHPDGYTPEFNRQQSDAFGWVLPLAEENPSVYTPDVRPGWVDLYGAFETGDNVGSGRAVEAGDYQTKNIGPTPAVFEDGHRAHANGLGNLSEGLIDTFWTLLNQVELPFGAVQNVTLLERDTGFHSEGRSAGTLILNTRRAPTRPAHYMQLRADSPIQIGRKTKAQFAIELANALPVPAEFGSASLQERIREGVREYVRRVALQMATAYAHKMDHNSIGLSNFDISGKFLDLSTQTGLPGYVRARLLNWNDFSGETAITTDLMIKTFLQGLAPQLPRVIADELPTADAMAEYYRTSYAQTFSSELLLHTGVPANIAEQLAKDPRVMKLAVLIAKTAREGAITVFSQNDADFRDREWNKYDIGKILVSVAGAATLDAGTILNLMPEHMPEEQKRELANGLQYFLSMALQAAARDGVTEHNFWKFMSERAWIRNAVRPETYTVNIRVWASKVAGEYARTKDATKVRRALYEKFEGNAQFTDAKKPYRVILGKRRSPEQDSQILSVYDADGSGYGIEVSFAVSFGRLWGVTGSLAMADAMEARFTATDAATGKSLPVQVKAEKGRVTVLAALGSGARAIDLKISNASGEHLALALKTGRAGSKRLTLNRSCEDHVLSRF